MLPGEICLAGWQRGKAQMLWGKGDAQAAALAMPYEQTHIREVMEKYTTSG
ncbi:MAG: hypothetical protein IPF56_17860 [Chloroflexi bacterium]|nr:hypothetical protein [Chloroflexota bacterium]